MSSPIDQKIKVIVIGSNPSKSSPDDSPFHASTRSRMVLDEWFHGIDVEIQFENVSSLKTQENRPLSEGEIQKSLSSLNDRLNTGVKLIALGKTAEKALKSLSLNFLAMPHPSGLNRQLNDKAFVRSKIEELKRFLLSS